MEFKMIAMNMLWFALIVIAFVIVVRMIMDLITDLIVEKQRQKVIKDLTNKIADDIYKSIEDLSDAVEIDNGEEDKKD